MRLIDAGGDLKVVVIEDDGKTKYYAGRQFYFGLFHDRFDIDADNDREAVLAVADYGEEIVESHAGVIRSFEVMHAYLLEFEDMSDALSTLAEFTKLLGFEIFDINYGKVLMASFSTPVVFWPSEFAFSFQINVESNAYRLEIDFNFDAEEYIEGDLEIVGKVAEFCTNQLCKFYEADKTKTHLLKYRDAKLGMDLGL